MRDFQIREGTFLEVNIFGFEKKTFFKAFSPYQQSVLIYKRASLRLLQNLTLSTGRKDNEIFFTKKRSEKYE